MKKKDQQKQGKLNLRKGTRIVLKHALPDPYFEYKRGTVLIFDEAELLNDSTHLYHSHVPYKTHTNIALFADEFQLYVKD